MAEPISEGCSGCASLPDRGFDELTVVGGSPAPYGAPWGELRKCSACGAYFRYTLDHDNAIGSGADVTTLSRITSAEARKLAQEAIAVAKRQLAYFSSELEKISALAAGDRTRAPRLRYARHCADGYTSELERLEEELRTLASASP